VRCVQVCVCVRVVCCQSVVHDVVPHSFGVLLNELVSEDQPFAHAFRTGRLAGRGPLAAAELACRGERPHISDTTPSAIAEVVRACWAPVPADRPSFERVAVLLRDIDFPSRVDA
jgi:hypothetical protein